MVKQHRLHHFLDGTVAAPPAMIQDKDTPDRTIPNPAFEEYESLDSALASWLLASVAPSILPELVGLESANQIWNKLLKLHSNKSDSKILMYKNQLSNLKKGSLSMREYLANIKSICDHLAMLGEKVDDAAQVSYGLNGLTSEYEAVITVINAARPRFDLDTVTNMLVDAEARQKTFIMNSVPAQAHYMQHAYNENGESEDPYALYSQAHFAGNYRGHRPPNGPGFARGGRFNRGRGRSFTSRP